MFGLILKHVAGSFLFAGADQALADGAATKFINEKAKKAVTWAVKNSQEYIKNSVEKSDANPEKEKSLLDKAFTEGSKLVQTVTGPETPSPAVPTPEDKEDLIDMIQNQVKEWGAGASAGLAMGMMYGDSKLTKLAWGVVLAITMAVAQKWAVKNMFNTSADNNGIEATPEAQANLTMEETQEEATPELG